jgi:hypothetical protein
MSAPEHNADLEEFLATRTALPPALQKHEQMEPPAHLDRLVLQQARAAIEPSPARKLMNRNRWFVPLTLAATIVLSFTIVLKIRQQTGDSPFAPMQGRVITEPASAKGETVPMDEPRLRQIPERELRREAVVPQLESAGALADAAVPSAEPLSEEIRGAPKETDAASDTAAFEAQASRSAAPAAVAAAENRASGAQELAAVSRDEAEAGGQAEARGEAKAGVSAVAAAPPPPAAPSVASVAKVQADPRTWLERIRRLRADGKMEEAERELQAFRKRYPDYAVESADTVAK